MGRSKPPFEEQVMQVVRGLVEYGLYGGAAGKAARALKRRCPEQSLESCRAALVSFERAYRAGIAFVAANEPLYAELRGSLPAPMAPELKRVEEGFLESHPEVPPKLLSSVLFFIHDWHHLR